MLLTRTSVGVRQLCPSVRIVALVIIGCGLFAGCGKAGPPTGRVAGKVMLDGEPLGAGQVHLYSKRQGAGGRATLDAAGNFKVATALSPGEYTALVTPPPPTVAPGVAPRTPAGASSNPVAAQTVNIPNQYLSEATSDLKVTVEADKEVAVVLELHGDGRPAPVTPVKPATDLATPTPREKGPAEKAPTEKAAAEPPIPSPGSVETTPVTAKSAEPASRTGDTPSFAASSGVSGQTWVLAAGGGAFVLAAIAVGAFIILRGRSAPVRPVHAPFAPHPVSAAVAHGPSAAFPRLGKAPGTEKPPVPPGVTAQEATSPTPGADQAPVIPQVMPPVTAPVAISAPAQAAGTAPVTAATAPDAAPVTGAATAPGAIPLNSPAEIPVTAAKQPAGQTVLETAIDAKPEPVAPPAKVLPVDQVAAASAAQSATPPTSAPLEERAAERSIAEWVLERGGRLRVRRDEGESLQLSHVSEIPAQPFRVSAVLFRKHNALGHDDLERLAGLADLHQLDLTSSNVTDGGLRHIARHKQLRELALSRTKITDDGLQYLREMHELRVLLLYRTSVSDTGLAHLRNCKSLRLVELKHTQVTDAGVQLLIGLPKLEELVVDDTRVTREGIARIQKAFPRVKISSFAKGAVAETPVAGSVMEPHQEPVAALTAPPQS